MDTQKTTVFVLTLAVVGLPVLPAFGSNCGVTILYSNPGGFGFPIDAGQPHEPYAPENPQGYDMIQLWMSGDATGAEADDFYIMTSEGNSMPIENIYVSQQVVTLLLYDPIPVQAWTAVTHCSKSNACIGYLPGDVDNSGVTNGADILAQIDCLNDRTECTFKWCHDIDRDDDIDEDDLDRLMDLLDGVGYDPWYGESIPDCDCGSIWAAPTVEAAGSRYLAITPADPDGLFDMSFVVTCSTGGSPMYTSGSGGDLNISILTSNPASAAFQTPDEWLGEFDAVHVTGLDLAPSITHDIEADYGASWLSEAATATTWVWCDVDDSGDVDYTDIGCMVDCFLGNCGGSGCENATIYSCDVAGTTTFCLPDGVCDFTDIGACVDAFKEYPYPCNDPCD